jgi:hypothetical protein
LYSHGIKLVGAVEHFDEAAHARLRDTSASKDVPNVRINISVKYFFLALNRNRDCLTQGANGNSNTERRLRGPEDIHGIVGDVVRTARGVALQQANGPSE